MKKATKAAIIARHEENLAYLDLMLDLNADNPEAVKQISRQYRETAKLLAVLLNTKADDE